MVKFSDVIKTSEASKYVCYWREVCGVKAASGYSRLVVSCRTTIGLLSVESFCIRSVGNSGSVFLFVSCNIPYWLVVRSWEDSMLAV